MKKEAKVDIRSDSWLTKSKKQKTTKQTRVISENCWLEVIWRKRKEEEKVKEEMKLYKREKWVTETLDEKMNDWDANSEMNERFDEKNTWLTANDEIIWWETESYDFDNFDDEELDDEFDHLIDDRIRSDSQWYKTMIWLSWWCNWCYHLLQWMQSYEV